MKKNQKKAPEYKTREQFQDAVNQYAILENRLRADAAHLAQAIQAAQQKWQPAIDSNITLMEQLRTAAETYARQHPETLEPGTRQGETTLATYRFRMGNPEIRQLSGKHTLAQTIENIIARGKNFAAKYLRQGKTTLNKDALKADLTDAELATLGLRREQQDKFLITAKATQITE